MRYISIKLEHGTESDVCQTNILTNLQLLFVFITNETRICCNLKHWKKAWIQQKLFNSFV